MAEEIPILADPTAPIDVEIAGETPHVFAYKVWTKPPGEDRWTVAAEGHSEDEISDAHPIGPLALGTLVAWWLGVGGPPESWFRAAIRFRQGGEMLAGGERRVRGRTGTRGGAVRSGEARIA
ncbi:MAG TPA: hypothetical protein VJ982_09645 [Gemmatimonadota bacterium]|nr:hypothetical protein [Gemmatimonadota bacterium]